MTDSTERVVSWLRLTEAHRPTGATSHRVDGKPVEAAAELRVMQFEGDPGFYLIHLDKSGEELTDTYHETIEQAFEQAHFEYGIVRDEWCSESLPLSDETEDSVQHNS